MKNSPKKLTVEWTQDWKNNFHERCTHRFLLKLSLGTIRVSFFHTGNNFSYTFSAQSAAFLGSRNLCQTEISSPYPVSRFICFQRLSTALHSHLEEWEGAWKFYSSFLRYIHQLAFQLLEQQYICQVLFHLYILNTISDLQLFDFLSPYMHGILELRNKIKIDFLFW